MLFCCVEYVSAAAVISGLSVLNLSCLGKLELGGRLDDAFFPEFGFS
jgi:hypothetical protein